MLYTILLGSAGDAHGVADINWLEMGALWFNFFVLVWLVPKVVKSLTGLSPKEHLKAQRENLKEQLEEARTKQAEAERRLAEYVAKLDNLEDEVKAIVKNYEAQGDADRKRLEEDADKAVERLVREADFSIRQESLKAQKEIREVAVTTTIAMAESLVKERITDADRRRLADEYIGSVEQAAS